MRFLIDDPGKAYATVLLAHGAGAPMDSTAMAGLTSALVDVGLRVARFEFEYMAAHRVGRRTPPPRAELLKQEYCLAVGELKRSGPLIIGGKSMGARVASMVVDEFYEDCVVTGLLCIGYPFHPPAKPQQLRTAHLETLKTPALFCQGTRDKFGTRAEVETYGLPDRIEILWLEDGDHDLQPRKKLSGFSQDQHLKTLARTTRDWVHRLISS